MTPEQPISTTDEAATKGERTAAVIVEAAYDLFVQRGYHGTSMRQIAERAGIAPGGLYNHFPGKEALFAAVLDAHHPYRQLLPALGDAQGDSVDELVRDAAHRAYEVITRVETNLLPLAFIELVEFQGRHLARVIETVYPSLEDFARRFAERRGELRPVPVPVALRTFIGLVLAYVVSDLVVRNTPLLKSMDFDWFDGMLDIYLHGIVALPPAGGRAGEGQP
jgi:AcrR family transcriptional regulator